MRDASIKANSTHNWCRWAMHVLGCEPAEPHVLRERIAERLGVSWGPE